MSELYSDLESKLEAIAAREMTLWLEDKGMTGAVVLKGLDEAEQTLPCVIMFAEGGREEVHDTGIYRLTLVCMVKGAAEGEQGSTPLAGHRAIAAAARDWMNQDDMVDRLNLRGLEQEIEFTCQGIAERSLNQKPSKDGNEYHSRMEVEMVACGSIVFDV